MNWRQFEWVSFDCYGTLIDWESGILGYVRPLLRSKGCDASDARILNLYSELEPREQSGPYRTYREVLASVMRGLAKQLNFELSATEAAGLAESIAQWKPFPDTVQGLRQLQSRYKLAILSNIDDDLFAFTAKRLEVPFDLVVTAQHLVFSTLQTEQQFILNRRNRGALFAHAIIAKLRFHLPWHG